MRVFEECHEQGFSFLKRTDRENRKLAIFVHGFGGTHLTTWGDLGSCLELHADSEGTLDEWDYLFFGYDTLTAPSVLSISRCLATCIRTAAVGADPFERSYERFALFGHSLGTLAIRQLLCITNEHPQFFVNALHAVVLFASPVDGSWMARWSPFMAIKDFWRDPVTVVQGGYKVKESLEPGGQLIDMLRTWYANIRMHVNFPRATIVQGSKDKVLGYEQHDWDDDDRDELQADHVGIVKVKLANWRRSHMRSKLRLSLR